MATLVKGNVDYRLLGRVHDLVLCSRCFRAGRVTPIPQLISKIRKPSNICPSCRAQAEGKQPQLSCADKNKVVKLFGRKRRAD